MNSLQKPAEPVYVNCPFCGLPVELPYKTIDFYVNIKTFKTIPALSIERAFTLTEKNKDFVQAFCIDSLKRRPFISKIILTKPYHMSLIEMTKLNLIDSKLLNDF